MLDLKKINLLPRFQGADVEKFEIIIWKCLPVNSSPHFEFIDLIQYKSFSIDCFVWVCVACKSNVQIIFHQKNCWSSTSNLRKVTVAIPICETDQAGHWVLLLKYFEFERKLPYSLLYGNDVNKFISFQNDFYQRKKGISVSLIRFGIFFSFFCSGWRNLTKM